MSAFTIEQLYEHFINSDEPWGRNSIDQSTPWEVMEKTAEFTDRSGITTPTPSSFVMGVSSGLTKGIISFPSNSNESAVWNSEVPTGTGIWEMHYGNAGHRFGTWQSSVQPLTYREMNSVTTINTSNSNLNKLGICHTTDVTQFSRSTVQKKIWSEDDSKLGFLFDIFVLNNVMRFDLLI